MRETDLISKELQDWCDKWSNDIVLPNFYCWQYEMDIFKMTSSWYIIEYEIKVSRSDFYNDFQKWYRGEKHKLLKDWKLDCNRFFFVVPRWLVSKDEVPNHCGLIYYDEDVHYLDGRFEIQKGAKILHKNKKTKDNTFLIYLIKKLALRDSLNKSKIYTLKKENRVFKKQIKTLITK